MGKPRERDTIVAEWLALAATERANDTQASDFAWRVADRSDGSNRSYQEVMNLIRRLVGRS